ncbi:signal transduction histidine kinase [Oxalobacteraceae bacterium GrIS 2.11]
MKMSAAIFFHLEQLAPYLQFPVYWTDPAATILGANQAFADAIGAQSAADLPGKTVSACFPGPSGQRMLNHLNQAIIGKQLHNCEEEIGNQATGASMRFINSKSPLINAQGSVFGVVGTMIPVEQSAQSRSEQSLPGALSEQQISTQLAQKMAHDIQSPLAALSVIVDSSEALTEPKRLILKNAFASISDITNNILNNYSTGNLPASKGEEQQLILCSDFLLKLVSERKFQYQDRPVRFAVDIAPRAQFAFINVQSSQFGRAMSNLVANAVDALKDIPAATVNINLELRDGSVLVQIKDNGKGMSRATVQKILRRTSFTKGKKSGHGLGMMQVWDMVDANGAQLNLSSRLKHGTCFELVFPRADKPDWLVDEINVSYDDTIIILDDEQLIHDSWDVRLQPLLMVNPEMAIRHETQGQAVIDFVRSLNPEQRQRVCLFSDFELLHQSGHGLQVIEECKLPRAYLVTSYYNLPVIQKSASQLGIKILPKQMALVTPLYCTQSYGVKRIEADQIKVAKNFYHIEQTLEAFEFYRKAAAANRNCHIISKSLN